VGKQFLAGVVIVLAPVAVLSQAQSRSPKTADLGFLIGTWKLTAVHFDTADPKAAARQETGTKACRYALETAGEPAYIVCENSSIYRSSGEGEESHEAYVEYLNYNPHVEAFEKTNFFSSFPVKVIERVTFDAATRTLEIRGRVEVGNSVDSYVEYWRFDAGYSAFDREALINRSSMPMTEYRRIVSGRNVRVAREVDPAAPASR